MRILLANPNTTAAITDLIAAAARRAAAPGTQIVPVTANFGAAVIGTRAEMAVAEHAAFDLLARHAPGCDAAIVGASLDSGVQAGKQALAVPVLGLTEAVVHAACLAGGRFGAVVLSQGSAPVVREMIDAYGLRARCAGVIATEPGPRAVLEAPDAVAALVAQAANTLVATHGADSIVLIGAVMAEMPAQVQPHVPVPVLEGVSCAVALAEALVRLRLPKPAVGSYANPA